MEYAWLDGRLVPASEARVSLFDPGFLHGEGVFETIRIHGGAPFRLEAHLARLRNGFEILGFPPPAGLAEVSQGMRALVAAWRLEEGLVRITATPPADAGRDGILALTARPLPTIPQEFSLVIAASVRRVAGPLSRCKTTSRVAEAYALREALRVGATDAVLLNPEGRIVETTARNVFVVESGSVRTPPLSEGALPGITRAAVLELAVRRRIPIQEVPVPSEALETSEEIFVTGSGVGVSGVNRAARKELSPVPGPVTAKLTEDYRRLLDRESKW